MSRDIIYRVLQILTILTTILLNTSKAKNTSYISADVSFNDEYFEDFRVRIDDGAVDIIMNTSKDYKRDPWVTIAIISKMPKMNRNRTMLDYNVNVCSILGNKNKSFLSTWIQDFFKLGNLPKSCPFQKGNYSWLGMRPDMFNLPRFFAGGEYISKAEMFFRNKRSTRESLANISVTMLVK